MAINRSTFFQWLDDEREKDIRYTEIMIKQESSRYYSAPPFKVYAVTAAQKGFVEWVITSPFLVVGSVKTNAAAGALAGKFRRWLEEYNNDRY